ncbi:TolC family protein [Sphingobacterium sp. DN00404]|uniref:TolC family protein n=1 Tax=Sphingobacterium micropteri TaxID=2763501 RepID=A0ABR7YST9_9SPHI|nr:TolC family protein [Sphingobacterium micropteri]MBD1434420.1 TolC family protein [Sphingobacterium micropteri]
MINRVYFTILCCFFLLPTATNAQKRWTLEDCIEHALQHNLDIGHKTVDIALREQDWQMAKRERMPSVNGYTNIYSNFGHSQDVFGTIQRNDNLNSNMGITAEIILHNFGTLRNKIKQTQIDKNATELERLILERELTVKVIQGYLDMLLQQALVQARDSAVLHANHLFERAKRTTKIGTTALADVYEAQAALARENQQLESAKIDVERARLHLAQLMLLEDEQSLDIMPVQMPSTSLFAGVFDKSTVLKTVYSHHPVLQRFDTLARGMDIERRLIRGANYPTLKGSTSIGSTYFNPLRFTEKDNFFRQTQDNFAQQVAITASIPIFNKGQTRVQLKQLDLSKSQLMLEKEREKQEIRNQIQQLLFDFQSNQQQHKTAKEVMTHSEQSMLLTQKSYEAGRSSIYDYNNSRNQFIQAQNDWLRAQYSELFSYKMLMFQMTGQAQVE